MVERILGMIPGTGKQSKGIALRLAKAGFNVYIGSRSKEKATIVADELNKQIGSKKLIASTNDDVAKKCNMIFLVVPYESLDETLTTIIPLLKPNTIIVDVVVPLIFKNDLAFCVGDMLEISISEKIKTKLPEKVSIVGAFKTISASKLLKISQPLDVDVFLTSDDSIAKTELKVILSKITGLRVLDAGPLIFSRTIEQMTALIVNMNKLNNLKHASYRIVSLE